MRKSARLLGLELGKSAREMNALLREHGYLEGTPGSYSLTEKGMKYGAEEDHHRGVGGYSWYNRDWTTRTWDEEILTALADEIDADHVVPVMLVDSIEDVSPEMSKTTPSRVEFNSDDDRVSAAKSPLLWLSVAFLVSVGVAANPRARHWVSGKVKPPAMRIWRKIHTGESADVAEDGDGIQENVTEPEGPTSSN